MIRNVIFAGTAIACCLAVNASANEAMEKAVKARQGLFQVYAFNLGQLGAMAKGAVDYDAEAAQTAADNLMAAVSIKGGAMWPQGSDNTGPMKGKTRAKPEGWTTWPEISKRQEDMVTAVTALQPAAGQGLDALKGAIGDVGKSCKACHEDFRAKEF
jgi:cytochrome c556